MPMDEKQWTEFRESVIDRAVESLDMAEGIARALEPISVTFDGKITIFGNGTLTIPVRIGDTPLFVMDDEDEDEDEDE